MFGWSGKKVKVFQLLRKGAEFIPIFTTPIICQSLLCLESFDEKTKKSVKSEPKIVNLSNFLVIEKTRF